MPSIFTGLKGVEGWDKYQIPITSPGATPPPEQQRVVQAAVPAIAAAGAAPPEPADLPQVQSLYETPKSIAAPLPPASSYQFPSVNLRPLSDALESLLAKRTVRAVLFSLFVIAVLFLALSNPAGWVATLFGVSMLAADLIFGAGMIAAPQFLLWLSDKVKECEWDYADELDELLFETPQKKAVDQPERENKGKLVMPPPPPLPHKRRLRIYTASSRVPPDRRQPS